jgi:hypothetical protein
MKVIAWTSLRWWPTFLKLQRSLLIHSC